MNVTTSIWGAANTWTEVTEYNRTIGKVATFANNGHTLYDAVNSGNLTWNTPITDYSLSWCAHGSESNYTKMHIFVNNTDELTGIKTQEPLNFFMYYINSGYGQQNYAPTSNTSNYRTVLYNGYDPGQDWSNLNDNRYIQPFTDFYIKNCVWLVLVDAVDSLTSNVTSTFEFKDYKNNHMTTHPIILHIYAVPYFGTAGQRTQITSGMSVGSCLAVAPFNSYCMFSTPIGEHFYQDFALSSTDRKAEITLFGSPAQNITGTSNYIFTVGSCKRKTTSPRKTYQDDNLSDVLESALKTIACFGFYFVLDLDDVDKALDDEAVYMGVIPADGVTHGEYTHGSANRDNLNWNWNTSSDSTYDWTKPTDHTVYDTTTVFGTNSLYNTFIQYYALSPANLTGLCNVVYTYINSIDTSTDDVTQSITKTFYTNNPLDVIVSLKKLPFNIVSYMGISSTAVPIKLGNLSNAGATGYKLNGSYTVADFGSYYFFPHFDNTFLDYSPYTYAELIIPFCGSVRLDMAYFMGHTMHLKMVVDLYTGACTCYILADNLCIDSVSGNCAIDVPISGIQSADFQNSVQNAITNVKNAKLQQKANQVRGNMFYSPISAISGNTGKSAWLGNMVSGLGTSLNPLSNIKALTEGKVSAQKEYISDQWSVDKAGYDLQHIETPFNSVGSQSSANSYVEEMQARLIIYRPKFVDGYDSSVYGATEGFACMKTTTVSSLSGYTQGDIVLNGVTTNNDQALTDEEKTMIINAFAKGVIL